MKEYSIYIKNGSAKAYILQSYRSFYEAKNVLLEMVELEKERGRPYYVGNKFYQNEYPSGMGKFMQIKCREISPWFVCENENEDFKKIKSNKIIKIY